MQVEGKKLQNFGPKSRLLTCLQRFVRVHKLSVISCMLLLAVYGESRGLIFELRQSDCSVLPENYSITFGDGLDRPARGIEAECEA
jgi:hypothetical protein